MESKFHDKPFPLSISNSINRWGPDGGNTLMSVFRRLRSPASLGS